MPPTPHLVRDQRQLGAIIRQHRRQRGLSQAQLAILTGLRQATISALETGQLSGRLDTALRVLGALDLDLSITPRQDKSGPNLADLF